MVRHHGQLQAPLPEGLPPMTEAEMDRALLVLRDAKAEERIDAFARLKAQDRAKIAARMRAVRPVDPAADTLGQSRIDRVPPLRCRRALVYQCNEAFADMTWQLIQSVRKYGNAGEAKEILVAADEATRAFFADKVDAVIVAPLTAKPRNWMKNVVWSVARLVEAEYLITLESDLLCVGDFSAVWSALEAADERAILAVKGQFLPEGESFISLGGVLRHHGADARDLGFITGLDPVQTEHAPFMFNGGLFAGHRRAFVEVEARLRSYYPFSLLACEGWPLDHSDELVTFLAIAQSGHYGFLHPRFNKQVFECGRTQGIKGFDPQVESGQVVFPAGGKTAALLHFVGPRPKQECLPIARGLLERDDLEDWEVCLAFDTPEALRAFALREALKVEGLVLEFGVFEGRSLNELAAQTSRTVYGFDVFSGLPEDWNGFKAGHFACAPPSALENVELIIGAFEDTIEPFLDRHLSLVAFAHIDADLYSSTKTILKSIACRLKSGAVLLFDEMFGYDGWEQHEWKAWKDFTGAGHVKFSYIGHCPNGQQVAVRIL